MLSNLDIGIDLGTANVLIYIKDKGIVLRAPSVVAVDKDTNKVIAIGNEAKEMIGRHPPSIEVTRPLSKGVIADYDRTESMLKSFIQLIAGKSLFFKPRIMICVPASVTGVEKRAVLEAALQAGASKTFLIEEPLAAALGAGIDISEAHGSMVVDIGGGTLDIAVLSLGGIVISDSIRIGGDDFDEAIIRYVKKAYNTLIGERTAELVKTQIATVHPKGRSESMEIRGRDLISGLPKTLRISSEETYEALFEPVGLMIQCIRGVLERTPPELAADIVDRGIVLTGGGALLNGFDMLLQENTGINVVIAEDPLSCVANGTGKALESIEKLQDYLTTVQKTGFGR